MNDAISRRNVLETISYVKRRIIDCRDEGRLTERQSENVIYVADLFAELISDAPALDVAPVVHAYWIEETFTTYIPVEYSEDGELILHQCLTNKCSVCGRYEHEKESYCNCGARMDGEAE